MLENKVVVVFGGAGLLGKEFTKAILVKKARVIVIDTCEKKMWDKMGISDANYFHGSINDKSDIEMAIENTIQKYGCIDAVVNTAYPRNKNWGNHFFDVRYEDFNENVSLNLGGHFLVAQLFAQHFIKQGYGNIIGIASVQGVIPPRFDTYENTNMTTPVEYSVIKAGIIHLTKYMAKYLSGKNIRVNCISPGGILDRQPKTFINAYKGYCCTKGMLDSTDINGTLLFLLSDESKYINGQNIIIDDGFTL